MSKDTLRLSEITSVTDELGQEHPAIMLTGTPDAVRAVAHLFMQDVRLVAAKPALNVVEAAQ